jgi:ketosteroid isomerase-like protein
MSSIEESHVRQIVMDWADAVSRADRAGILSRHADDLLMYDFPSEVRGLDAYDRTWDFFFSQQVGPLTFAPSEVEATVGGEVAFVTCNMHCDGTTAGPLDFRLTVGLEKREGAWTIRHEHHSVRTTEERFIDNDAAQTP